MGKDKVKKTDVNEHAHAIGKAISEHHHGGRKGSIQSARAAISTALVGIAGVTIKMATDPALTPEQRCAAIAAAAQTNLNGGIDALVHAAFTGDLPAIPSFD